jgi:drug/metabolite transporter (DMT)-like permease
LVGTCWRSTCPSVATGTALTATQPIFTAIFIKFKGGQIPKSSIKGMLIAFYSVIVITGVDLNVSIRSFQGDLPAIMGLILVALYLF